MVALLIEAIKEQQKEISHQRKMMNQMQEQIVELQVLKKEMAELKQTLQTDTP